MLSDTTEKGLRSQLTDVVTGELDVRSVKAQSAKFEAE